jgi:hypothetical protein
MRENGKNKMRLMIVSIAIATLFIGTSFASVVAGPVFSDAKSAPKPVKTAPEPVAPTTEEIPTAEPVAPTDEIPVPEPVTASDETCKECALSNPNSADIAAEVDSEIMSLIGSSKISDEDLLLINDLISNPDFLASLSQLSDAQKLMSYYYGLGYANGLLKDYGLAISNDLSSQYMPDESSPIQTGGVIVGGLMTLSNLDLSDYPCIEALLEKFGPILSSALTSVLSALNALVNALNGTGGNLALAIKFINILKNVKQWTVDAFATLVAAVAFIIGWMLAHPIITWAALYTLTHWDQLKDTLTDIWNYIIEHCGCLGVSASAASSLVTSVVTSTTTQSTVVQTSVTMQSGIIGGSSVPMVSYDL